MDRHYTRDELESYVEDRESAADPETLESHLTRCAECRALLADARSFVADLASSEVWHFTDELVTRARSRPLVDLHARLEREDEEARRLLNGPLSTPLRFLWANVAGKRRFHTGGVVRLLCTASREVRENNPLHARNLAESAAVIAERLPDDCYPAAGVNHLRGLAWKELANALRYLGELGAALDAVDRAERAYRRLVIHDAECAAVLFVRGTVLWKQQRLEEALRVARDAAREFARLGDRDRWVDARLLEGGILFDAHDGAAARDIFLQLHDDATAGKDPVLIARIESNLGNAYLELGDIGSATKHFLAAVQLYDSADVPTEAARTRWSIGYLTLVAGNAAEAERRLRAAKDECEQLGLSTDAALVLLDLVEALLVLGRLGEVRRLGTELVSRFTEAGMRPAILTAVAFIHEAAADDALTPAVVQHVRQFLRWAESDSSRSFVLPPR